MSEQDQTEEKGGSVVLPAAVAIGAGAGARHFYKKGSEKLVTDARNGVEGIKPELKTAAAAELAANDALNAKHNAVEVLKEKVQVSKPDAAAVEGAVAETVAESRIDRIKQIDITKQTGENTKGFNVKVTHAEGTVTDLNVDKLTGEGKTLLGDKPAVDITKDELKKLTAGGEKSWVAKTAAVVEKDLNSEIRKSDAWKTAGGKGWTGLKATVGHLEAKGKFAVIGGTVVAATSAGIAVKNLFGGKHTDQVVADRAATPDQAAAR